MKKIIVIMAAAALLSACAGLSINVDLAATYRSDVPLGERLQK